MASLIMMHESLPSQIFPLLFQNNLFLIGKVDKNTIRNFVYLLSYENWENIFLGENVNIIYNNFVNTYLRIFYASFSLAKFKKIHKTRNHG
jgi:hypothetical protein